MLTRRNFAGVASCALCAVTGFIATDASAQSPPPATTPGVTRKVLSQTDGPVPGYVTIIVEAEIEVRETIAKRWCQEREIPARTSGVSRSAY